MSCRRVSWSDFPLELLLKIVGCLQSRSDIQNFRAVCKTWSRSISSSFVTSRNILSPLLPHSLRPSSRYDSYWLDSDSSRQSPVLVATHVFLFRSITAPTASPWLFTAEELHPSKLFVSKLLSPIAIETFPTDFPKTIDLSYIQVSELAAFHRLRFVDDATDMFTAKNLYDFNDNRVVLFKNPKCTKTCPSISDCTAMILHHNGALCAMRLRNGKELPLGSTRKFDDIVNFKQKIYAIDRKGRAYMMDYGSLSLTDFIREPLNEVYFEKRKRLAVSSDCQELYLIYRWCRSKTSDVVAFNIYKLNEKERKWDEVGGIGDDMILFVTFDGCFFVSAKDFQGWKGNCIVFYSACFASYSVSSLTNRDRADLLSVYDFEDGDCQFLASYQSKLLWPPPAWLSSPACMSKRKLEQDEVMQPGSSCRPSSEPLDVQNHVTMNNVRNVAGEAEESIRSITSSEIFKSSASDTSTVKFKGLEVKCSSVPMLHRIWSRHGNIIEKTCISNGDIIAKALESLANVVLILEGSTGKTLNDREADYLKSTLSDLRHMNFNIDWLANSVEKALALHKSKPMVKPLNNLLKVKAQAVEIRFRLMEKLDRVEKELDEGIALARRKVPFSEREFEQSLGKGLV